VLSCTAVAERGHFPGLVTCFSRKVAVIPTRLWLATALDNKHHRLPLEIMNCSAGLQLESSSKSRSYISNFAMFLMSQEKGLSHTEKQEGCRCPRSCAAATAVL